MREEALGIPGELLFPALPTALLFLRPNTSSTASQPARMNLLSSARALRSLAGPSFPRRTFASSISRRSSPASTAADAPPTVATSAYLKQNREAALNTPGLIWRDEEVVGVGEVKEPLGTTAGDLLAVDEGGRETQKMK